MRASVAAAAAAVFKLLTIPYLLEELGSFIRERGALQERQSSKVVTNGNETSGSFTRSGVNQALEVIRSVGHRTPSISTSSLFALVSCIAP